MSKLIKSIGIITFVGILLISCESEINSSQNNNTIESLDRITAEKQTIGTNARSLGPITVGADASIWDSDLEENPNAGIYPIGGSGQINGEFTVAERNGVQIGLRIQERFEGPYETSGKRVGVYESETGFSSDTRAVWNYDWHVDLRNAKGKLADKTLGDYNLTLETDIAVEIFGSAVPFDLTFGELNNGVLYQGSWNPDFGNDTFDPTVERNYNFRLVLTPKTFNGAPLAVKVKVVL